MAVRATFIPSVSTVSRRMSALEHDLEEAFPARGGACARLRARDVQEADAGGKSRPGAQLGLFGVEPVVQVRLTDRREDAQVCRTHAGCGVLVGTGPFAHRPLQRPM